MYFKISVFNCRLTLKEEKEKRQTDNLLSEEIKEQFIKKEQELIKETEKNRELENTVGTLELKLKILLENSNQVNLSFTKISCF